MNYRKRGFDDAYNGPSHDPFDSPRSDGDRYDYRRGHEEGDRRREISEELERDYFEA